jgi:hypothetical protein
LCSGGYQLTRAKYVTAIHSPLSGMNKWKPTLYDQSLPPNFVQFQL